MSPFGLGFQGAAKRPLVAGCKGQRNCPLRDGSRESEISLALILGSFAASGRGRDAPAMRCLRLRDLNGQQAAHLP